MKMNELLIAFSRLSGDQQRDFFEALDHLPITSDSGHYSPYHTRNQRCVDCAGEEMRKICSGVVIAESDIKRCNKCLAVKSKTDDFYRDRTKPDGFSYDCKDCRYPQRHGGFQQVLPEVRISL